MKGELEESNVHIINKDLAKKVDKLLGFADELVLKSELWYQ